MLTGTPPGVGVFRKPPIWLKVIVSLVPRLSVHDFIFCSLYRKEMLLSVKLMKSALSLTKYSSELSFLVCFDYYAGL